MTTLRSLAAALAVFAAIAPAGAAEKTVPPPTPIPAPAPAPAGQEWVRPSAIQHGPQTAKPPAEAQHRRAPAPRKPAAPAAR